MDMLHASSGLTGTSEREMADEIYWLVDGSESAGPEYEQALQDIIEWLREEQPTGTAEQLAESYIDRYCEEE